MSQLEEALLLQIRATNIPAPVREHPVCEGTAHRFDLAWPAFRLACEVEGGTWNSGRHTRGAGFERDCFKYNLAMLESWDVFRFTGAMIESGEALATLEAAFGLRDHQTLIQRHQQEIAEKRRAGARKGWITRQSRQGGPR